MAALRVHPLVEELSAFAPDPSEPESQKKRSVSCLLSPAFCLLSPE
jgi:hypothetical protein